MEALRSYLTTAMLASVVSAICIQFTDERFRKYVKFIAGLCLLALLTFPLVSLVRDLAAFDLTFEGSTNEKAADHSTYLDALGSQIAQSVGDRVALLYSLPREAIFVTLTLDTADMEAIEIVSIDICVKVECDEEAMEEALAAEFACTVYVREEIE